MAIRVAAIVVTYNRREMLLHCIAALQRQKGMRPDIFVIDNASTDNTAQAVEALANDPCLHYHNTGKNLGGAGGFQYGMRLAVEAGFDYLWLMDDDCVPDDNALEAMLEADRVLDGEYGFLSGMVRWTDGSPCSMNVQRIGLVKKLKRANAPCVPITMATFVSCFIPAARVWEVGLPYKEFFIWADDMEYTRRLSRLYPCYAVTGSRAVHHTHANHKVNITTDRPERLHRYRLLYRNEVVLYRQEGLRGRLCFACRIGYHILRILKGSQNRLLYIRVILASVKEGLHFRPQVEYPHKETP